MLTAVYANLRINDLTISKRFQLEDVMLTVSIVCILNLCLEQLNLNSKLR